MKRDSKNIGDIGKNLALVTQMGIMILAPVGLCMFVANLLIKKYNLGDGIMIIAILLGISAGFLNIYKILRNYFESGDKSKKKN
ncbi:AtpZ/AtpI family protein [Proteocatella sphenisci]|uniref:AtpZ/AtpI family protein n=1 Tax=Proteocatella sphenisci TaxID=181070 RepID=UPI0004B8AAC2|nr:AtpZ/AtpI family protein [Proteocatella sphenisci]